MKSWRLISHPGLLLGISIVLGYALIAAVAPIVAPPQGEDPYVIPRDGYAISPRPPAPGHPLGTMEDQYDVLYGLIWGTRVAFRMGILITLGCVLVGIPIGVVSGYYGGWIDALLMRITDAFLSFPTIAAVLLMLTVVVDQFGIQLGEGNRAIVIALVLFGWMRYARLVRGNVLVEQAKEYVNAALCIGAQDWRIVFRHILPNASRGLFVLIASDIGAMVVTITTLTFIGLSGDEPSADWGMMLKFSRNWIIGTPANAFEYWYTYVPPSLAIVLFSIGWNLVGDGLRDTFDPRMHRMR